MTAPGGLVTLIQVKAQRPDAREARRAGANEGAGGVEAAGARMARRSQRRTLVHVFAPRAVPGEAHRAVAREGAGIVPAPRRGVARPTPAFVGVDARPRPFVIPRGARAPVGAGRVGAHLVGAAGGSVRAFVDVHAAEAHGGVAGRARAHEGAHRVAAERVIGARAATCDVTLVNILTRGTTENKPLLADAPVRPRGVVAGGMGLTH